MTMSDEWERIAARIHGLNNATATLWKGITAKKQPGADEYGLGQNWLIPSAKSLIEEIETFRNSHKTDLTETALKSLDDGLIRLRSYANKGRGGIPATIALIGGLVVLESELSFHIHDFDSSVQPSVERAFLHLQRSLVVDSDLRKRWLKAFQKRETQCEKLGAVHLLLHGIYAFKTSAKGERTDLVLGQRLTIDPTLRRSVNGLVLTEWKLAESDTKAQSQFKQALEQASRYSEGILAGFELQRYRYLVLVSEDTVSIPEDRLDGKFMYRHINITISPSSPSRTKPRKS